jgi:esterase/lipase superfamily enzyme
MYQSYNWTVNQSSMVKRVETAAAIIKTMTITKMMTSNMKLKTKRITMKIIELVVMKMIDYIDNSLNDDVFSYDDFTAELCDPFKYAPTSPTPSPSATQTQSIE